MITRETENLITDCKTGPRRSDHHVIHCNIEMYKPKPKKTVVTSRKFPYAFSSDLFSEFGSHSCAMVDDLTGLYQDTTVNVLNKHAPVRTTERTCRIRQPWYSNDVHEARRKYERWWRKSNLEVHREVYVDQRSIEGSVTQWIEHQTLNTWMTARRGFESDWCQKFVWASCAPEQGTLL